ncbi:MAG: AMP-binding protein [Bacteroidaceae bacterium]|nr:AMP-binding protein [Bacteroidaceae bacterium]
MDYGRIAIIAGERRVTFSELLARINQYAAVSGLGRGTKTVVFAENREEWIYALYSVWQNGGVAVPVDAMSTAEDVAYILRDCQPEGAWVSRKRLDVLQEAIAQAGVSPKVMVMEETPLPATSSPQGERAEEASSFLRLYSKDETDTALIVYTSGTTGTPKGVMLSFRNLFANVRAVSEEVRIYHATMRVLILLPLHHVLPLMGTLIAPMMLGAGVTICPSMTGPDIMKTLAEGDVHMIIGVPRLWQTIYGGVMKKIDGSPVARVLFWLCKKANNMKLSRTVFSAVHKKLGGRLEFCVNGGAAIPKEVAEGMKTLGLDLLDGYGMTEMAPMISFTRPGQLLPGSVGKALPCVEVKFVDGELCAKGPNLMQGYYHRPEETAEVVDKDGFIHTGDLGHVDSEGHIFITGRTKEIIVLSNGKNINPTEIEYKLEGMTDRVKEVGVAQDGDKLCAIVVPDELWARDLTDEAVEQWLKQEVVEPYNQSTESYKRVLRVVVYRGELPRTRMEKLQRYKLPELLQKGSQAQPKQTNYVEPTFEEYRLIKQYIEEEKRVAVKPTDSLDTDLALDSLDKVGLQSFVELTFGLKLTAERVATFRNVLGLAEYVSDYKTRIEVEKTDWAAILHADTSHIRLPKTWWTAGVLVKLAKWLGQMYFGLEGRGMENIPDRGPFIVAPNHQSYLDGMFVTAFMPKHLVLNSYFYAKQEHVQGPFARMMAAHNNVVVVDLNNLKESIQTLGEALKRGKNVIVFPEGTRTRTGELGQFKKMFAILCKELNVPIVPVCIKGAFEAMPKGQHHLNRTKVTVDYLPVVSPADFSSYDELSDKVRNDIAAVLH